MQQELGISERRACRAFGQHRSTQRNVPQGRADEDRLTDDIIELADKYGRYGYRMIAGLLNNAGWHVNHKRVERIWRREGLKAPQEQKKKGRLWLNDGSCVRLRPKRPNHVWPYDFVQDRTADGRAYRTLNIIDEYTKEALMIRVDRKLNSTRCAGCTDRPVHLARPAGTHKVRQRPGIHRSQSAGLDRSRWSQDGLYRARITLGKRIL